MIESAGTAGPSWSGRAVGRSRGVGYVRWTLVSCSFERAVCPNWPDSSLASVCDADYHHGKRRHPPISRITSSTDGGTGPRHGDHNFLTPLERISDRATLSRIATARDSPPGWHAPEIGRDQPLLDVSESRPEPVAAVELYGARGVPFLRPRSMADRPTSGR